MKRPSWVLVALMRYGILFILQGLVVLWLAQSLGGVAWALVWPGFSFLAVAAAYLFVGPGLFAKSAEGRLSKWRAILLAPYLWMTWGTWHLALRLSRERTWDEVSPDLIVGRRPMKVDDLAPGVDAVLDLTCEFNAPRDIVRSRAYHSLPILDAGTLSPEPVVEALRAVFSSGNRVLIHCAQGHGRTGMVAALALGLRGHAESPAQAIEMLKRVRPGVRLNERQRHAVEVAWASLGEDSR